MFLDGFSLYIFFISPSKEQILYLTIKCDMTIVERWEEKKKN